MAQTDVTMTADQWDIVRNTLGNSGSPADVRGQYRMFRTWEQLSESLAKGGVTITIELANWQRRTLLAVMQSPPVPWRVDVMPRIWEIMERFGWQRPAMDDDDDEEIINDN